MKMGSQAQKRIGDMSQEGQGLMCRPGGGEGAITASQRAVDRGEYAVKSVKRVMCIEEQKENGIDLGPTQTKRLLKRSAPHH